MVQYFGPLETAQSLPVEVKTRRFRIQMPEMPEGLQIQKVGYAPRV